MKTKVKLQTKSDYLAFQDVHSQVKASVLAALIKFVFFYRYCVLFW